MDKFELKNIDAYQFPRLSKGFNEVFYVVDVVVDANVVTLKITGSKLDIYTVIMKTRGQPQCDCPDAKSHAKRQNVFCKHVCFVIFRCLQFPDTFLNTKVMTVPLFEAARSRFVSLYNFADPALVAQYHKVKDQAPSEPKLARNLADPCAVCFEETMDSKNSKMCDTCLNAIHNNCWQKWTQSGHNMCPFCRHVAQKTNAVASSSHYLNLR